MSLSGTSWSIYRHLCPQQLNAAKHEKLLLLDVSEHSPSVSLQRQTGSFHWLLLWPLATYQENQVICEHNTKMDCQEVVFLELKVTSLFQNDMDTIKTFV